MTVEALLFALIRSVVCGEELSETVKNACTEERLKDVFTLAGQHDLAHLLQKIVGELTSSESEVVLRCRSIAKEALFRYVRLDHAYTQICQALETAKILFIPLKGSILRDYYPEPWMRTSSDIDILVREEQLELAANVLKKELKYDEVEKGNHDISLFSPAGVHLELHYNTVAESEAVNQGYAVLSQVWETAKPERSGAYFCRMPDAMFYFYHIVHMAKHLRNGGCGIRPFLDLWIMDHRMEYDALQRKQLLAESGLLTFGETAERLSEVWFSGAEPDALTDALERFVLGGGVYGTLNNKIAVNQNIRGGKFRYALSRIWLTYDQIKYAYPVLHKHKWLTPVYQVVRWCKLLFCGGVKRSVRELKVNAAMTREEGQFAADLLKNLGLK